MAWYCISIHYPLRGCSPHRSRFASGGAELFFKIKKITSPAYSPHTPHICQVAPRNRTLYRCSSVRRLVLKQVAWSRAGCTFHWPAPGEWRIDFTCEVCKVYIPPTNPEEGVLCQGWRMIWFPRHHGHSNGQLVHHAHVAYGWPLQARVYGPRCLDINRSWLLPLPTIGVVTSDTKLTRNSSRHHNNHSIWSNAWGATNNAAIDPIGWSLLHTSNSRLADLRLSWRVTRGPVLI